MLRFVTIGLPNFNACKQNGAEMNGQIKISPGGICLVRGHRRRVMVVLWLHHYVWTWLKFDLSFADGASLFRLLDSVRLRRIFLFIVIQIWKIRFRVKHHKLLLHLLFEHHFLPLHEHFFWTNWESISSRPSLRLLKDLNMRDCSRSVPLMVSCGYFFFFWVLLAPTILNSIFWFLSIFII